MGYKGLNLGDFGKQVAKTVIQHIVRHVSQTGSPIKKKKEECNKGQKQKKERCQKKSAVGK